MKKKAVITALIAVVCVFVIGFIAYSCAPDCTTLEEREERLNEIKSGFVIAKETEVDGHIISAAYSENQVCLTVFKPEGNGYEILTNVYRDFDDIVTLIIPINGVTYDFFWLNATNIQNAQVIYTNEKGKKSPFIFDVENNEIVCSKSPFDNYTIEFFYTDINGNRYE